MTSSHHPAISIVILAAGSSSRMGQPKQLLPFNGFSLLEQAVITAKNSKADHVLVVLGSGATENKKAIKHLSVETILHDRWAEGMGSSLKKGLTECLKKFQETKAILVMVCDQPKLTTNHLNALIDTYSKTQNIVVASRYASTVGVPAIFDHSLFGDILRVDNHQGAKSIILKHQTNLMAVDLKGGEIDLDTPEDYKTFTSY